MEVKLLGASVLKADIIGMGSGKQGIYFAFSAIGSEIEDLGNNPCFSHSGTISSNSMCAKIYLYFFLQNNFLQSPWQCAGGGVGVGVQSPHSALMKKTIKTKTQLSRFQSLPEKHSPFRGWAFTAQCTPTSFCKGCIPNLAGHPCTYVLLILAEGTHSTLTVIIPSLMDFLYAFFFKTFY